MDKITLSTMITMMLITIVKSINADFFGTHGIKKKKFQKKT